MNIFSAVVSSSLSNLHNIEYNGGVRLSIDHSSIHYNEKEARKAVLMEILRQRPHLVLVDDESSPVDLTKIFDEDEMVYLTESRKERMRLYMVYGRDPIRDLDYPESRPESFENSEVGFVDDLVGAIETKLAKTGEDFPWKEDAKTSILQESYNSYDFEEWEDWEESVRQPYDRDVCYEIKSHTLPAQLSSGGITEPKDDGEPAATSKRQKTSV